MNAREMGFCNSSSRNKSSVWRVVSFLSLLIHGTQACSFSRNLGSSNNGDSFSSTETFKVGSGGSTTCSVSCSSGSGTGLYLRYGGAASILFNDGSDFSSGGCSLTVTINSDDDEFTLGWSLSVNNGFSGLTLSCDCTKPGAGSPSGGGGVGCFSGSATVEKQNEGAIAMKDLKVGDKVLTGKGHYQPIYGFGHFHETFHKDFLRIYTKFDAKVPLEITGNHMVFVIRDGQEQSIRADSLQAGDLLVHTTMGNAYGNSTITKITNIQKQGMYMPLTPDGTIVVNGLKASNYVTLADDAPMVVSNRGFFGLDSEQLMIHWYMAPYRMLCMGVSPNYCSNSNLNEEGILNWLLFGRDWASYADEQNLFVRVVIMGVPVYLVFSLLNLVEVVFGPSLAPFFCLVAALICFRRRPSKNAQGTVGGKR